MKMPIIRPVPISLKNRNFIMRIIIWFFSTRKWEMTADWRFVLHDKTEIVIPKGFIFDGASVPKLLWAILSPVGLLFIPGLIHDYSYKYNCLIQQDDEGNKTLYQNRAGKWYWDKLFLKTAIQLNGFTFIDLLAWLALTVGGWWTWLNYRKKR